MELKIETINDVTVVYVQGDIFADEADQLRELLEEQFNSNHLKLVLNLEKTDVISSVGLGMILSSLIKFRKYNGDIYLCSVRDFVRKILHTTKVDSIIEVYNMLPAALEAFAKKS